MTVRLDTAFDTPPSAQGNIARWSSSVLQSRQTSHNLGMSWWRLQLRHPAAGQARGHQPCFTATRRPPPHTLVSSVCSTGVNTVTTLAPATLPAQALQKNSHRCRGGEFTRIQLSIRSEVSGKSVADSFTHLVYAPQPLKASIPRET